MPSVRVKGRRYSTISEGLSPRPRSQPLSSYFSPTQQPLRQEEKSPEQNAHYDPDEGHEPRPSHRLRRPLSKIHYHVTNRSARASDPPLLSPQDATPNMEGSSSPPSPLITRSSRQNSVIEGSQTSIMVQARSSGTMESVESMARSHMASAVQEENGPDHWDEHLVDHLDAIDPQVGTVSILTNAANSIILPPFLYSSVQRKPVIVLTTPEGEPENGPELMDSLDRHVDDVLSRPSRIRRTMLGVWSFLKTPMGIITAIYGFLVAFWGAAIVLFLAKIINLHNENTQGFWVEVSSQVTNGLFTITGIGLIPFRALDTYRIFIIWKLKRKTRQRRAAAGIKPLVDEDDLPDPQYDPNYVHVLTDQEQAELRHQQAKFQYSQTWYRPHGTETHRAFPINTALLICLFNDGNSFFQILLCACMWSMNRFQRPAWTTGTLIPASFLCGIASAVLIWRGGQKTKRTKEVGERLRAALDADHPEEEKGKALPVPNEARISRENLGASLSRSRSARTEDSKGNCKRSSSVVADIDEQSFAPLSHSGRTEGSMNDLGRSSSMVTDIDEQSLIPRASIVEKS